MSYTRRPRPRLKPAKRSLGDFWSDIYNTFTGKDTSSSSGSGSGSPPNYDINDPSGPGSQPTSSSSTTQDTTVLPDGSVIGGQATGTPTAQVGQWKTVGGVCYATNSSFLGSIKELQRQLNRALTAKGIAAIGVDGSVGAVTRSAVVAVGGMGAYKTLANPAAATCDAICANIYAFTAATEQYADGISAPTSVSSPAPAAPPQVWNPVAGKLENQGLAASATDLWGNLSSTEQAVAVAGVAAVGYWAWSDSKKLRRRKAR